MVGGRFGNDRADAAAPRLDKTGANASSSARGGGREVLDMQTRFFEARGGLTLRWILGREQPSEERAGDLALSFGDKPEWREGSAPTSASSFLGETAGARTTDPERVSSALHHGHEHMHRIAGQPPDGTPGNPLRRNAAGSARTIG